MEHEPLLLFLAATTQVVSTVLVVEREEEGHAHKVQRPMYFVSEVLSDTKTCYSYIQKLLYAVLITKCKLLHYFDSHPITIVFFPLSEVIQNKEVTGRITKWALELMGKGIEYAANGHKISGPSRFPARMDGDPITSSCHRARILDHVLQWLPYEDRSRCRAGTRLAPRGADEVRDLAPLPRLE